MLIFSLHLTWPLNSMCPVCYLLLLEYSPHLAALIPCLCICCCVSQDEVAMAMGCWNWVRIYDMLWPRGTFLVLLSYISQDSWLEANEMNSGYFKHNEQFLGGCRSLRSQWGSRAQVWGSKRNQTHCMIQKWRGGKKGREQVEKGVKE